MSTATARFNGRPLMIQSLFIGFPSNSYFWAFHSLLNLSGGSFPKVIKNILSNLQEKNASDVTRYVICYPKILTISSISEGVMIHHPQFFPWRLCIMQCKLTLQTVRSQRLTSSSTSFCFTTVLLCAPIALLLCSTIILAFDDDDEQ